MYGRIHASEHGTSVTQHEPSRTMPRSTSNAQPHYIRARDRSHAYHAGTAVSFLSQLAPTRAPSPTAWFSMALCFCMYTAPRAVRQRLVTKLLVFACAQAHQQHKASGPWEATDLLGWSGQGTWRIGSL